MEKDVRPVFRLADLEVEVRDLDTQFLRALAYFGVSEESGAQVVRIRLYDELSRRLRKRAERQHDES